MEAERILAQREEDIRGLCVQHGVRRLRIFGSALRNDWNPESSDFDFLAEFEPMAGLNAFDQYMGFVSELEKVLGRHVDVVDWNAARNPFFRRNAEKNARELYAA